MSKQASNTLLLPSGKLIHSHMPTERLIRTCEIRVAQSIGIPKNPEISGSIRKSSLGTPEEVYSARAKYRESEVGGGGG